MKRHAVGFILALVSLPLLARSNDVTLPALGHLALPHVTYTSEIVITNHRDVDQRIRVDWMARDGDGTRFNAVQRTLPAKLTSYDRGGLVFDILGINKYAMGAARLVAIDAAGNVDPDGDIEATAYIVAYRPGGSSSRQEIEGVPSSDYHAPRQTLFGIRHDEFSRTNVGIVNMDPVRHQRFVIEFHSNPEKIHVSVPPLSMRQVPLGLFGDMPDSWLSVMPLSLPAEGWVAYATSVDQATGDAWTAQRVPQGHRFNP